MILRPRHVLVAAISVVHNVWLRLLDNFFSNLMAVGPPPLLIQPDGWEDTTTP